jgi:hypothetical protein
VLQNICEVGLVETLGCLVMLFNILQELVQDLYRQSPSSHNAHMHRRPMLAVVIMHVNKITEQDGKNKLHWKASQYHCVHLCQKKGYPQTAALLRENCQN